MYNMFDCIYSADVEFSSDVLRHAVSITDGH